MYKLIERITVFLTKKNKKMQGDVTKACANIVKSNSPKFEFKIISHKNFR